MSARAETIERFACFGSDCVVLVDGGYDRDAAAAAAAAARHSLLEWHERFSRFLPSSELSRLNRDPRSELPVSALMARLAATVIEAGRISAGLVDATMVDAIVAAGYVGDLREPLGLARALALAPARRDAGAGAQRWREIEVDVRRRTVTRPPGLQIDSGGLAKGMFADVLAERLAAHAGFAVNCAGDVAIGGAAAIERRVNVESPFDGSTLHTFAVRRGGVATSGIGRRSWLDPEGRPAHHLLDAATGRPAFTGIVQATALAPSAVLAEIRAKSALLGGPREAARWLPDGGVVVLDDGSHRVFDAPAAITVGDLAAFARRDRPNALRVA